MLGAGIASGELHASNDPVSILHANVLPGSLEENVMSTGPAGVSPLGPATIVVSGATVSTVHSRRAWVWSVLLAASTARTSNVCAPCGRSELTAGDEQLANTPVSSLHSNDDPVSVDVNAKDADVADVGPCGPPVIDVSGPSVSTVHSRCAGVWSVLPAASVARTSKVCAPCAMVA